MATINGTLNDDVLEGTSSADVISGGQGADTLSGAAGNDSFVYTSNDSSLASLDVITDFHSLKNGEGEQDKINLTSLATAAGVTKLTWGGTTPTANGVWFQQVAADDATYVYVDSNNDPATPELAVKLNGLIDLTNNDFLGVSNAVPTIAGGSIGTLQDTAAFDDFTNAVTGSLASKAADADPDAVLTYHLVGATVGSYFDGAYDLQRTTSYGSLYLNHVTGDYRFDGNNDTINAINNGAASTSFTVSVSDGIAAAQRAVLTVNIVGTNDGAVITGAVAGEVTEAGADAGVASVSGQLTVTDVDNPASFQAKVATATNYGSYTLSSAGEWTYNLNNLATAVQALNLGQTLVDSFTVKATDGTTQSILITINGSNDAAVITGTVASSVTEASQEYVTAHGLPDGFDTASGVVSAVDIDNPANGFTVNSPASKGELQISSEGAWTYVLDNTNEAIRALSEGQTTTDSAIVQSADGTQQTITITIHGTNEGPVAIADTAVATEAGVDAGAQATGNVLTNDTDIDTAHDALAVTAISNSSDVSGVVGEALVGQYGSIILNADGSYSYVVDDANPDVDQLAQGQQLTETFTYSVSDGEFPHSATLTITINGANDAPVIDVATSVNTGAVVEADNLIASGQLVATDVDSGATAVWAGSATGVYGSFEVNPDSGVWTYNLNNDAGSNVDKLAAGEVVTEIFPVTVTDDLGASVAIDVTVTITGTNDLPVITSDAQAALGAVQEAGNADDGAVEAGIPSATGTLTASDIDNAATAQWSFADSATTSTDGAYGSITINPDSGEWVYNLANDSVATGQLAEGQTVTETFTARVTDDQGGFTDQVITIEVTGSNDSPVISVVDGADQGAVTEDTSVQATGQLTATDVDLNSALTWSVQSPAVGTYGEISVDQSGLWTYNLNNGQNGDPTNPVQVLAAGETAQDSFTLRVQDENGAYVDQLVTVTINGTNDVPVISGDISGQVAEDSDPALLTVSGSLQVEDIDNGQSAFVAETVSAGADGLGSLSIDASGAWSYSVDNTLPAIQSLAEGVSIDEAFTVKTIDGTEQVITVSIVGTNDLPVISSTGAGETNLGLVTENLESVTTGKISITDADTDQSSFVPQDFASSYGSFQLAADGAWIYTLDNNNPDIKLLATGESLSESFTAISADGSATETITITINGTDGALIIDGSSYNLTVDDSAGDDTAAIQAADLTNTIDTGSSLLQSFALVGGTAVADPATALFFDQQQTNAYGIVYLNSGTGEYKFAPNSDAIQGLTTSTPLLAAIEITNNGVVTPTNIVITLNGVNDTAVISGTVTGAVVEAGGVDNADLGTATATGSVTSIDRDLGESGVFQTASTEASDKGWGSYSVDNAGNWSYTLDNNNPEVQALAAGDSTTDTFTLKAIDGTEQQITITVQGTDDAAVVSSDVVALDETNAPLTTSGNLTISDVDSPATFVAQTDTAGVNGSFSIDEAGAWTYTANQAFDSLNVGESVSDTFAVLAADGTATSVQVTINGTNDAAVLSSEAVVLDETNALLTATGALTISDVDNAATFVAQTDVAGTNGSFSIDEAGAWIYTANQAFDSLNVGDSVTDSFEVSAADGTTTSVQVTINGTDDAAVLSSAVVALDETNEPLTTSGSLTISDVDSPATFVAQTETAGVNGTFSIDEAGAWTYTANQAFDSLNVGDSVVDSFNVLSSDGTATTVEVTINGTNDAALLSSDAVVLDETNAPLTATGALTISDVDNAATFVAQTDVAGSNGSFSIDEAGVWTYTANQAFDSLNLGESVSDTFAVLAADGTATSVQVTINGTNDAAVLSADVVALDQTSEPLTTSGALTITDVDNPVTFIAQTDIAGTNGTFSIDEAGAWTYTANQAFASLTVGESVTDSFEVSAADGTTSSVQVTINGVNDAAVLSSAVVVVDQTSEPLTTSGTLTISDIDSPATFVAQDAVAGANGTFSIDEAGAWSYVANQAFASLSVGESVTDSFDVLSADGTATSVQVTINGTNDAPVITSGVVDAEGAVTEAGNAEPGIATVSGTLTSSDVDAVNTATWSINGDGNGSYGTLAITPEGTWTYTLDNSRDATQALADGQTEQDVFTARVVDDQGAFVDQIITVSVAGANDELVLSASLTSHTYDLNDATGVTTPTVDGLLTAVGVGTETFGVAGGFLDSGFELKDTPYGTVFVNTLTGEYRFDVNEAALADVTAGQNPTDLNFELTVTDSSSATDSEELVISFTGNDNLTVDSAAVVDGNGGNDLITDAYSGVSTINAGLGNDKVLGAGGNDKINGDEGNDYLFGGHGTDGINGGDGDDVIIGGSGYDFLSGGAGADSFRWANIVVGSEVALGVSGSNGDSISDYSFADGDLIDLSSLNATVDVTDLSFYHDAEQDSNFLAVNGTNLFEIVDATQIQVLIDGDHQTLPLTV